MIDDEVILLKSVYDHIGEMVNFSMVELQSWEEDNIVVFKGMNERALFYILLVDFLSKTDRNGPIKNVSFLQGLTNICESPVLAKEGSEAELKSAVRAFRNWLNSEKEIDIWMPSIEVQLNLKLTWADAVRMSGDVSKHNYLRSVSVATRLAEILEEAGKPVSLDEALMALPDFYDRFHDDILIYLSSHLCEFLNNIRLGIHAFLEPEFQSSFHKTNESIVGYSYKVPDSISSDYGKHCYWDLMNYLKMKPYMVSFTVPEAFKNQY